MALTRKFLQGLGLESEVIDSVINEHTATITAIKTERDELNEKLKGIEELNNQINTLKTENESLKTVKSEFDTYKSDIENKEIRQKKESKLKQLLADNKANEQAIPLLMTFKK